MRLSKILNGIIFIFLFSENVKSQHCPFDGSAIVVLHIHEEDSVRTIPNLKITLLDSLHVPIEGYYFQNGMFVEDTLFFWQNPSLTTFRGYIDNNNPADVRHMRFPFARDNYVLVLSGGYPIENCFIQIEEIAVNGTLHYFPIQQPIPLYKHDLYSLCGTYDDENYRTYYYGTRPYHPVELTMKRDR
jgi:hypothetical protein